MTIIRPLMKTLLITVFLLLMSCSIGSNDITHILYFSDDLKYGILSKHQIFGDYDSVKEIQYIVSFKNIAKGYYNLVDGIKTARSYLHIMFCDSNNVCFISSDSVNSFLIKRNFLTKLEDTLIIVSRGPDDWLFNGWFFCFAESHSIIAYNYNDNVIIRYVFSQDSTIIIEEFSNSQTSALSHDRTQILLTELSGEFDKISGANTFIYDILSDTTFHFIADGFELNPQRITRNDPVYFNRRSYSDLAQNIWSRGENGNEQKITDVEFPEIVIGFYLGKDSLVCRIDGGKNSNPREYFKIFRIK